MFKLFRIHNDEYIIVVGGASYSGSLIKTIDTLSKMGVRDEDIEEGLTDLQLKDHHVADYGVGKTMIFSKRLVG